MTLPLMVVLVYLGIGPLALMGIFSWRRDMWSMVKNSMRDMGLFGLWYWMATSLVVFLLWIIWVLVLVLAIRREALGRPNIAEKDLTAPATPMKRKSNKNETVSREQVQQLEKEVAKVGPSVVKGKLKESMNKIASAFIRDEKKQGAKEVTVDDVLVNADASPEFMKLCERIGFPREDMVKLCEKLGAVDTK